MGLGNGETPAMVLLIILCYNPIAVGIMYGGGEVMLGVVRLCYAMAKFCGVKFCKGVVL